VNEEKRGKVSEGEVKFFASPSERRKIPLKKAVGCPFFVPFLLVQKRDKADSRIL